MSFGKPRDEKKTRDEKDLSSVLTTIHPLTQVHGKSDNTSSRDAFLGRGTKVQGSITFSGPVELEGEVDGEIVAQERLLIGESAKIQGKVTGTEIIVKGEVRGDLCASRKLILRKPARVHGNLSCALLSIEEGVIFEGRCMMELNSSSIAHGDKTLFFNNESVSEDKNGNSEERGTPKLVAV